MNEHSIKSSVKFDIILLNLIFNKFFAYSNFNTKFFFLYSQNNFTLSEYFFC